jgi:ribosomal protein S18 acetylase RimI-like enzyme
MSDVVVRAMRWPDDEAGVASIPTGWTAERMLAVQRDDLGFTLVETPLATPYDKDGSSLAANFDALRAANDVHVAEVGGAIVGVAALCLSEWNFRPSLEYLRVAPDARLRGVGTALVTRVIESAQQLGARGLWLEVTNVNVAAIALYRKLGFRLCGLDEALYMRWGLNQEAALYFLYEFGEVSP